jgi:hypothetical protein
MNQKIRLLIFLSLLVTYLPFDARATHPMDKVGEVTNYMYNLDFYVIELHYNKNIVQYQRLSTLSKEDKALQKSDIQIQSQGKFNLPQVSYHLSKESAPIYEIREDGHLYYQGKIICHSHLLAHIAFHEYILISIDRTPEDSNFIKQGFYQNYTACPESALLFGTPSVHHRGKYRSGYRESKMFGLFIAADDFDGKWGRIDGVLENGEPLYFRFADDEYQHLSVMLETQSATRFAREHFKNFDQLHVELRQRLLDEKSITSQEFELFFTLDTSDLAREIIARKMTQLESNSSRLRNRRFQPRDDPRELAVLTPEERSTLESWHNIARSKVLSFLETRNTPENFWAELKRDGDKYLYSFGFLIKEINIVVLFDMTNDSLNFGQSTGPAFYHLANFPRNRGDDFISKYESRRYFIDRPTYPYWDMGEDLPARGPVLSKAFSVGKNIIDGEFVPPELSKKYLDVPSTDSNQAPAKD